MKVDFISSYKQNLLSSKKDIINVVISVIPNIFSVVSGLLTSILIARGLGPSGMGEFALLTSIYTLIPTLSDLGINQSAIKFASKALSSNDIDGHNAVFRWTFRIRTVLLALITLSVIIAAPYITKTLWHSPHLLNLLITSLLIGIFMAIMSVPHIYFQSNRLFIRNTVIYVIQYTITIAGIAFLAFIQNWSLSNVIWISIISTGIAAFIFVFSVPKEIFYRAYKMGNSVKTALTDFFQAPELKTDNNNSSNIYSFTFFLTLTALSGIIFSKMDIWLMGYFLSPSQIGIYSVALRFTLPLVLIINGIHMVLWPKVATLKTHEETVRFIRKIFSLCLPLSVGFIIYSCFVPLIAPYVFGPAYNNSILLAQLLCVQYCAGALTYPLSTLLYNSGFEKPYFFMRVFMLLVFVMFNILLLPKIGYFTPVIGLILCEILNSTFIIFMLRHKILRKKQTLSDSEERRKESF